MPRCTQCDEQYSLARFNLGYMTCLDCGESHARRVRHTVVPMHKSNYIVASSRDTLKQLNPKG